MSRSAGPGSPLSFRCNKCRSTLNPDRNAGSVTLTGRERPNHSKRGHALGVRSTTIKREYRCNDCGHVGWSSHVDLMPKGGRRI